MRPVTAKKHSTTHIRTFLSRLLIFTVGWGFGWAMHIWWGTAPAQLAQPFFSAPSKFANAIAPTVDTVPAVVRDDPVDSIALLLQRNEFERVVGRYESFQAQTEVVAAADTRTQILSYARRLTAERRFSLAEQLLQRFLVAAYRDVEARVLLAETYRGQDDFHAAIDQYYEARGYAYRPERLQRISARIRSVVAELTEVLKRNNDNLALLALYQHLTQTEPDYAPWFIGLATAQLAVNDKEAARRSLLLVLQDPNVGTRAQMMLAKLSPVPIEPQNPEPQISAAEVTGIPLQRYGNNFVVGASPARGLDIQLLIDTGASLTIFTPDVLKQRGIRYQDTGRTGIFNTANGRVQAPIYILDSLTVGDWQVKQLEIGILDLGSQSGINGLLGMNFLSHFQFFIDQNEAVLRLSII